MSHALAIKVLKLIYDEDEDTDSAKMSFSSLYLYFLMS